MLVLLILKIRLLHDQSFFAGVFFLCVCVKLEFLRAQFFSIPSDNEGTALLKYFLPYPFIVAFCFVFVFLLKFL